MRLPAGLARHALSFEKNSPTMLLVGGVAGMVGSTVFACRGTLKLEETLKKTREDLEIIRNRQGFIEEMKIDEDPKIRAQYRNEEYTDQEERQDTTIVYVRGVGNVIKLYAPAVALGAASIFMLTKSHNILQQRNAALTAAYVTIEQAYSNYRKRVIEKYGEDVDREIRFPTEEIEELNPKTGRMHKVKVRNPDEVISPYAKFFDQTCPSWEKDPETNLLFVRCQQQYANQLLHARGHVWLNEVYGMFGLPHTREGQIVGWIMNGPDSDNYVDFGVYNGDEMSAHFINGRENAILLDFNVDGNVLDLLGKTAAQDVIER